MINIHILFWVILKEEIKERGKLNGVDINQMLVKVVYYGMINQQFALRN